MNLVITIGEYRCSSGDGHRSSGAVLRIFHDAKTFLTVETRIKGFHTDTNLLGWEVDQAQK